MTATGRGKLIEEIADARSETERKLQQAAELEGEALDIINDLGDVSRELAVIHNGTQQQVPEDEAPDEAMRDVRPLVQEAEAQDDRDASQLRQQVEEEEAQVEEAMRGVEAFIVDNDGEFLSEDAVPKDPVRILECGGGSEALIPTAGVKRKTAGPGAAVSATQKIELWTDTAISAVLRMGQVVLAYVEVDSLSSRARARVIHNTDIIMLGKVYTLIKKSHAGKAIGSKTPLDIKLAALRLRAPFSKLTHARLPSLENLEDDGGVFSLKRVWGKSLRVKLQASPIEFDREKLIAMMTEAAKAVVERGEGDDLPAIVEGDDVETIQKMFDFFFLLFGLRPQAFGEQMMYHDGVKTLGWSTNFFVKKRDVVASGVGPDRTLNVFVHECNSKVVEAYQEVLNGIAEFSGTSIKLNQDPGVGVKVVLWDASKVAGSSKKDEMTLAVRVVAIPDRVLGIFGTPGNFIKMSNEMIVRLSSAKLRSECWRSLKGEVSISELHGELTQRSIDECCSVTEAAKWPRVTAYQRGSRPSVLRSLVGAQLQLSLLYGLDQYKKFDARLNASLSYWVALGHGPAVPYAETADIESKLIKERLAKAKEHWNASFVRSSSTSRVT